VRWARVAVDLPSDTQEAGWAAFERAGCHGVEIAPSNSGVQLIGHFPVRNAIDELLTHLRRDIDRAAEDLGHVSGATVSVTFVDDEDWASSWKTFFHPMRIGRHILVCPSWEDAKVGEGDLLIELDPGMAFGSGTHQSTQLALVAIEQHVGRGDLVIDVGCGSGILAIAAARMGARQVVAIDADPLAVDVARENVERNGVAGVVDVREGDLLDDAPTDADVIVANIVAQVIADLLPAATRHLATGGHFIGSGIVKERLELVRTSGTRRLELLGVERMDDWRSVIFRKLP